MTLILTICSIRTVGGSDTHYPTNVDTLVDLQFLVCIKGIISTEVVIEPTICIYKVFSELFFQMIAYF